MKYVFIIFTVWLCADNNLATSPHDFSSNENDNNLCIYCHNSENMKIDEPTLLCLSCHDGVSANISLNGAHRDLLGYNFGETSGNHPVSIQYNSQKGRLKNIDGKGLLKGPNNDMVECTSCHDPHKKKVDNDANFLRYPNKNSELCYQCHNI